jgi:hypothetical protein
MRNAPREPQSGRTDTDDTVSGAFLRIVRYGERRVVATRNYPFHRRVAVPTILDEWLATRKLCLDPMIRALRAYS